MLILSCFNSNSSQEFKLYFVEKNKDRTNTKEETKELFEVKIFREVPVKLLQVSKGNQPERLKAK